MSDLTMRRGDNRRFPGVVQRPNAVTGVLEVVDISGPTNDLWFSAKRKRTDADPAVIAKKNVGDSGTEIVKTDAPNGEFDVVIIPGDTSAFVVDEHLEYDVQFKSTAFGIETIDSGKLQVNLDVTIPVT